MIDDPFRDARAQEYPDPGNRVFLDSASYGLLPLRTIRAVNALVESRNRGDGFQAREWGRILWRCREMVASLLDCSTASVALTPNTSYGVNLAARWVSTMDPGRIVMPDGEFPANVYPWLELEREGFEVLRIPSGPRGLVDVAIGVSGLPAILDLRGSPDAHNRTMHVTEIAVVDEIAAAADLVMGKSDAIPVAVIRGLNLTGDGRATDLIRPPEEDMFR